MIVANILLANEASTVFAFPVGFFVGSDGQTKFIDVENKTVDVLVSMFGRETPATLNLTQVMKLDDI